MMELLVEINNQNKELLAEVKSLKSKSDSLINEIKSSSAKQEELIKKVNLLQGEIGKVLLDISKLSEDIKKQGVDIELIKSQLADLQKKYDQIIIQLEQLQQLSKILAEIENLKAQLKDLDAKYLVVINSLGQNQQALDALKSQVTLLQNQLAQNLTKISELTTLLGQQGVDIGKILAEIAELKKSTEEIKNSLEELLSGGSTVPTNGLVAWYPFNGNANDESGNNLNGTVNGANLTTDRFLKSNKAYSLNGVSSFISIPANSKILPSQLTLAVWVSIPVEYSGNNVVGRIIRSRFFGYALTYRTDDDLVNFEVWTNSSASSSSICYSQNKKMNDGIWHLIVGTFDGKDIRLFVDGVELGKVTTPNSSIFYSSDGFIYFGRDGNNSSSETALFQGKIDDIAIYNRALTAEEISKIYKGEKF
jgi:iron-sulfur cluster repair protein YtfE (RIC family)